MRTRLGGGTVPTGATAGLWKILCKKPCFDIKKREKLHLNFVGTAGRSLLLKEFLEAAFTLDYDVHSVGKMNLNAPDSGVVEESVILCLENRCVPAVRDGLRRWMDNLEDSDGNQRGPNNQRFQRQNNATSRRKAQCQEHKNT